MDFKMALALLGENKYKGKTQARDTCLRLILQGATWPAARTHEVDPGLSPECSRCGHHLVWSSSGGSTCEGRRESRGLPRTGDRASSSFPVSPFGSCNVDDAPHFGQVLQRVGISPRTGGKTLMGVSVSLARWPTDGSCSDSSDDRLRRDGCAVVQFGPGAQPLRSGSKCPGPRTVSRAELYALCCAVKYGTPPLLVNTDSWIVYQGVVMGIGEMASRVNSPIVDLWKQLHCLLADWPEHSFQVSLGPFALRERA